MSDAPTPKPEGDEKADATTITIRVRDQVCGKYKSQPPRGRDTHGWQETDVVKRYEDIYRN